MEVNHSFFNDRDYCFKIRNEVSRTTGAVICLSGEKTELCFSALNNKENQNKLVIYGCIEAVEKARDQIRVILLNLYLSPCIV